ncbi:MAG: hypothetical protein HC888_02630 [Candidatus Competibacteraceae bacterium]|nr:hypothetical protein [Candidatus Competibacteraceae bacterium]
MATQKFNVPGLKNSTGMKGGFVTLENGDYLVNITKVEIKDPADASPIDVWTLTCEIQSGPPLADGKSSIGQKYWWRIRIYREEHPDFDSDNAARGG